MLEVCVESVEAAIVAAENGAKRLEICSSLIEGGLTPTLGLVSIIEKRIPSSVKLHAMIRCDSRIDFCFGENEMQIMLHDVAVLKTYKVDGFVFGALTPEGHIDEVSCRRILEAAHPTPVTFHRAFDSCIDPPEDALSILINIGFERLLTSGRGSSAADEKSIEIIDRLLKKNDNRIVIMPGAGINENNVTKLFEIGVREVHASCLVKQRITKPSHCIDVGKNDCIDVHVIDPLRVKNIVKIAKRYNDIKENI